MHHSRERLLLFLFCFITPHLVTLCQTSPSFDESFPHDILILGRSIGVVIEDVRHVLVHVRQQRAELRPQQLVEQLLNAHAQGRLELWHNAQKRRDARARRLDFFRRERLGNRGRREQVFHEPVHVRCGYVQVVQQYLHSCSMRLRARREYGQLRTMKAARLSRSTFSPRPTPALRYTSSILRRIVPA